MDDVNAYNSAVTMHNHYSNVRAAVISFAAPVHLTICGFAIAAKTDAMFSIAMLAFATMFFFSIYTIWQYFSQRLSTVKTLLLRLESGAGADDNLFGAIYPRETIKRSINLRPRDILDLLILAFGIVSLVIVILSIEANHQVFMNALFPPNP